MFGMLSKKQQRRLLPFLQDRVVHDLGAGDLRLASLLMELGASRVVAIDKLEHRGAVARTTARIRFTQAHFNDYVNQNPDEIVDVAFMSWPFNLYDQGLYSLAARARTIIYLGCNSSGTACGFPELFKHFLTRKLEAHIPERPNVLLVLSEPLPEPREPTLEELGGIDQSKIYSYP